MPQGICMGEADIVGTETMLKMFPLRRVDVDPALACCALKQVCGVGTIWQQG